MYYIIYYISKYFISIIDSYHNLIKFLINEIKITQNIAGNRYFIALETQVYFLTNGFAENRKREQEHFITNTLNLLPSDAPKTVFMHKRKPTIFSQ